MFIEQTLAEPLPNPRPCARYSEWNKPFWACKEAMTQWFWGQALAPDIWVQDLQCVLLWTCYRASLKIWVLQLHTRAVMRTKQDDYFKGTSIAPGTEPALNTEYLLVLLKNSCVSLSHLSLISQIYEWEFEADLPSVTPPARNQAKFQIGVQSFLYGCAKGDQNTLNELCLVCLGAKGQMGGVHSLIQMAEGHQPGPRYGA